MPARLGWWILDHLRVHIRAHPVVEVALVRTHRGVHELVDDAGGVLAELCDDRVAADRVLPPEVTTQWREWEVELVEVPTPFWVRSRTC